MLPKKKLISTLGKGINIFIKKLNQFSQCQFLEIWNQPIILSWFSQIGYYFIFLIKN